MRIVSVTNTTKGTAVAQRVEVADGIWSRFWGLMGRRSLDAGAGLLLSPCSSVHTVFMRFPIDTVFLDREGVVLKVVPALKPYRLAAARGARQTLELSPGAAAGAGLEPGDRLEVSAP